MLSIVKDFAPVLVYGVVGKNDKSFSLSSFIGAERFKKEFGTDYREAQMTTEAQAAQLLSGLARKGYSPIISLTAAFGPAIQLVSKEFPHTKFVIVDTDAIQAPNVQTIVFKDQEGSFLVGIAAAMATKTGTVGFIGGMDGPLIRSFGMGYVQGVKYINQEIKIIQSMVGNTYHAFSNPTRGGEIAKDQFALGVDVVFAAATFTGLGVLQAARDNGKLAIGCNTNQNYLYPGSVLTSMVERVDLAIYDVLREAMKGTWEPGIKRLGLKEDGVDWALDRFNRSLISAEMEAKINSAKIEIINNHTKVVDYRTLNNQQPPFQEG